MARKKIHLYEAQKTLSDKISNFVTSFVGSWKFIVFQSLFFTFWVSLNALALIEDWDPYPFVFLNLVIALENVYFTPLIMMSQNKQEEKNKVRDDADYEADIKTEKMIEDLQKDILEMKRMLQKLK